MSIVDFTISISLIVCPDEFKIERLVILIDSNPFIEIELLAGLGNGYKEEI